MGEEIGDIADAVLDHYSLIPPAPGDPLPPIDPSYQIPPDVKANPYVGPFVLAAEAILTIIGTAKDLWGRIFKPISEYLNNPLYPLNNPVPHIESDE